MSEETKVVKSNPPTEIILDFHGPSERSGSRLSFLAKKHQRKKSLELIDVHKDDFIIGSNPPKLKEDDAIQSKYSALKKASKHTKISLWGHGAPDWDVLGSDVDAYGSKTGQITFTVDQVAHLIRLIPADSSDKQDDKFEAKRLRISVIACHGACFAKNLVAELSQFKSDQKITPVPCIITAGRIGLGCSQDGNNNKIYWPSNESKSVKAQFFDALIEKEDNESFSRIGWFIALFIIVAGSGTSLALTSTLMATEYQPSDPSFIQERTYGQLDNTAILAAMLLLEMLTLILTYYAFSKKHRIFHNTADKVVFYNEGIDEKERPKLIQLTKAQYLAQHDPGKLKVKLHSPANKISCAKKISLVMACFLCAVSFFSITQADQNGSIRQIKDILGQEVGKNTNLPIGAILAAGLLLALTAIYVHYTIKEGKIQTKVRQFEMEARDAIYKR